VLLVLVHILSYAAKIVKEIIARMLIISNFTIKLILKKRCQMSINKLEGEMIDHENKMMAQFKKERQEKIGNITFTMIKPEAVAAGNTGAILSKIEGSGFRIVALKKVHLSKEKASEFYAVHSERPFYGELVDYMCESPIVAAILEKDNAVLDFRTLIGATNPVDAAQGTIRAEFAESLAKNAVHGSDSDENANIEADFHFSAEERF
jgi:nucleoside-diphosphate kinase